jgi:Domain of unknown function (DUF4390)
MLTTMVFTMRCFAKWLKFQLRLSLLALCVCAAQAQNALPSSTPAIVGTAVKLTPSASSNAWDLQADFKVDLPARVADLARSTPLYFVLDWRMTRPRWYWRDERLAQGQLYWRLSHNPLTQQWRISNANSANLSDGRFAIGYASLNDALGSLRRIRRDGLVQSSDLQANQKYELSVRLRLDTTQLPKPFQINAITNSDWALDSGVFEHVFVAAAPISAMVPVLPVTPVPAAVAPNLVAPPK